MICRCGNVAPVRTLTCVCVCVSESACICINRWRNAGFRQNHNNIEQSITSPVLFYANTRTPVACRSLFKGAMSADRCPAYTRPDVQPFRHHPAVFHHSIVRCCGRITVRPRTTVNFRLFAGTKARNSPTSLSRKR